MKSTPPRQLNSQVEFDSIMSQMNADQTAMNHPYLDRDRELAKQCQNLMMQIDAIKTDDIWTKKIKK